MKHMPENQQSQAATFTADLSPLCKVAHVNLQPWYRHQHVLDAKPDNSSMQCSRLLDAIYWDNNPNQQTDSP